MTNNNDYGSLPYVDAEGTFWLRTPSNSQNGAAKVIYGGDLEIKDTDKVIECEYCGTNQTVPSADNEKKLNLFNRANRLRINGEFDKATALENLKLAEATATAYDRCENLGEEKYKSLFANRQTFNPKTVGKNWEGTESQRLIGYLENKCYDILRDNKELQKRLIIFAAK